MENIIPKKQGDLLLRLGIKMQSLGYYLAGGTALVIYFQHRLSIDIDWFTTDSMGDPILL